MPVKNEAQARELARLPDDEIPEVWDEVQRRHDRVTAQHIREVVDARRTPHVLHNSGDYEWFTPAEYIDAARLMMGGIDLDPASCHVANETVRAATYYTAEDDGLTLPWFGRVWLNPPYSQPHVEQFVDRLIEHLDSEEVTAACVLTNNGTETGYGQKLIARYDAIFYPARRIKFLKPEGASGAPLQGQMLTVFGDVEPARDLPGTWR